MYNTELNKVYTNKVVQVGLKDFADYCESHDIKCWICEPDTFQIKDSDTTVILPSFTLCDNWQAAYVSNGRLVTYLWEHFLNDDETNSICFLVTLDAPCSEQLLKEGLPLWVK